jgi:hypothetical protein
MNILNEDGSLQEIILEENFNKLNTINKINILLKAVLLEKNKNNDAMKRYQII